MRLALESTFNLVYWDSPSTSGLDETYSRSWRCPLPCSRNCPPSPSASSSHSATDHRSDLVWFYHCYFKVVINVLLLTPFSMCALAVLALRTCSSPTPRNFLYFSAVYSFFQKHRVPSYSFLTAWEAKASSPFFCGVKSCAKGEYLQVRKIFMELNRMTIANLSCVPYWLHTFSAQRARKKSAVCV